MKKIAAVLLTLTLTLSLAACGNNAGSGSNGKNDVKNNGGNQGKVSAPEEGGDASDDTSKAPDGKVYKIGICQQLEHEALDAATEGFQAALKGKLGEDGVQFDLKNAQGEQANCATIATGFVADNCDLIMANATTALQCAAAATDSIPILGTSVTDYGTALDMEEWKGASGKNISGTCDLAPLDEQEDMLLELFPSVKQVGILYCSSEANSVYQAENFAKYLEEDKVAYKVYTAADSNEIQSVVTTAVSECDVLYIPTDNIMASSTEIINNICEPAGIPVIAGEEGICRGCGVATLSISYYDLGYTTGEMAYEILVNGADISTMEVKYAPNITKEYNKERCDALGIKVPEGYTVLSE